MHGFKPLARSGLLAAVVVAAGACNLVFGIEGGTPETGTGGTGGATASTSSSTTTSSSTGTTTSSSTTSSGAGGADGGGCVPSCNHGALTLCDAEGNPEAPITCTPAAACDAAAQMCLTGVEPYGRLSVGTADVCAIDDNRDLWCWGSNDDSISTDPHLMLPEAVKINGVSEVRQVSVGWGAELVLKDDGSVTGWGTGDSGELGALGIQGGTMTPMNIPELAGAVQVGAAFRCSCARLADGSVTCIGATGAGCLGDGMASDSAHPTPVTIPMVEDAVQIAIGTYQNPSCAREASGKVVCWTQYFPPVEIQGVDDAIDIAVGTYTVFIRSKTNGLMWAGLSTVSPVFLPAANYPESPDVAAMAANNALVALQTDGMTVVWSALGNDILDPVLEPLSTPPPPAGSTIAEISAGAGGPAGETTLQCLRLASVPFASSVYCWGDDSYGALGADAPDVYQAPTPAGVSGVKTLTSSWSSTYMVLGDGTAELLGNSDAYSPVDNTMPYILAGSGYTLIREDDTSGVAYAFTTGTPALGLVVEGQGTPGGRLLGSGFTDFVDAIPMNNLDFGLRAGGAVVVYAAEDGANQCGVFGDMGAAQGTKDQIVTVTDVSNVTALAAYVDQYDPCPAHACALSAGEVVCWGDDNAGEIGDGNVTGTPAGPTTVHVPGETSFLSVAVGETFSCAVASSGKVYCWGANDRGQLGSGAGDSASPVQVAGITDAVAVSARYLHACALRSGGGGTVACWGANDTGQIGDGSFDDAMTPYDIPAGTLSGVTSVVAAPAFTCAVQMGGAVTCWGSSYSGQCGGIDGYFPTPQMVLGLP